VVSHQETRPTRRENVFATTLDDELVLRDPATGGVYVLNQTGADIWTISDGSRTPAEIARAIAQSYELEYERAFGDVCKLVEELRDANLLAVA